MTAASRGELSQDCRRYRLSFPEKSATRLAPKTLKKMTPYTLLLEVFDTAAAHGLPFSRKYKEITIRYQ